MAYNTVCLVGFEYAKSEEAAAGESGIYPGTFLKYNSSLEFELQDESEVPGLLLIADLDPMRPASAGGNTTMALTDAYTDGDRVKAKWVPLGAKFYALLAPLHSVTAGGFLSFAGYESPGALGAAEKSSANLGVGAMFVALETVDNSASSSTTRIVVQRVR